MQTHIEDLKTRIELRRDQMHARLGALKADTRVEAQAARAKIKQELQELEEHIKTGWENLTDAVRTKLHAWLDRN